MWAGKSVGKCILFESKWIVPTVFENQLEVSSANKWRSINYDGKIIWGVGLAKTQQDQICSNPPKDNKNYNHIWSIASKSAGSTHSLLSQYRFLAFRVIHLIVIKPTVSCGRLTSCVPG